MLLHFAAVKLMSRLQPATDHICFLPAGIYLVCRWDTGLFCVPISIITFANQLLPRRCTLLSRSSLSALSLAPLGDLYIVHATSDSDLFYLPFNKGVIFYIFLLKILNLNF